MCEEGRRGGEKGGEAAATMGARRRDSPTRPPRARPSLACHVGCPPKMPTTQASRVTVEEGVLDCPALRPHLSDPQLARTFRGAAAGALAELAALLVLDDGEDSERAVAAGAQQPQPAIAIVRDHRRRRGVARPEAQQTRGTRGLAGRGVKDPVLDAARAGAGRRTRDGGVLPACVHPFQGEGTRGLRACGTGFGWRPLQRARGRKRDKGLVGECTADRPWPIRERFCTPKCTRPCLWARTAEERWLWFARLAVVTAADAAPV
eukprot:74775-Chlamydomonas_euryale.AAC.3